MFNKKVKIIFSNEERYSQSKSESMGLNVKELLTYLSNLSHTYGKLMIENIDIENQMLYVTNESTEQFYHIDNKIEDIKEIIFDYIEKDMGS